jgi:ubiquitin C-terminal hydrolase
MVIPPLVHMERMNEYWNRFLLNNNSIVSHTFYGLQLSRKKCISCMVESDCYEEFNVLSLELPKQDCTLMV